MPAVDRVVAPVLSGDGRPLGSLILATLPDSPPGSLSLLDEEFTENSLAPIQISEGHEYLYEWDGPGGVRLEPSEVFRPDAKHAVRGRLRPGGKTGLLRIRILYREGVGLVDVEVRSTKLDYLSEYRWMLRDIAEGMTELVMSRFAASNMTFSIDPGRDAPTLYQRFSFIQSLLENASFEYAVEEVFRRPHVAWEPQGEICRVGQPMRPGSYVARELTKGGPRTRFNLAGLTTVPRALINRRTEATHDTEPNRFVLYSLTRWLQVICDIRDRLRSGNGVERRGLAEVERVIRRLEHWIGNPLFRGVRALERFPENDQVLQRRAGYRDIFKAYLQFDLAANLCWKGAEESYIAGQRDVAELYEYWAFIRLAQITSSVTGSCFRLEELIEPTPDGLNVLLTKRKERVLSGVVERSGRRLVIELCFNRTFSQRNRGSWSASFRPDYSLLVAPAPTEVAAFTPVVLHFDAKYRVKKIYEVLGDSGRGSEECESPTDTEIERREALREDLLKMHAYRDAIRRTAGAYVLYPGSDEGSKGFREFHELLPGLGAFVLRPTAHGAVVGEESIRKFINDVLDHLATRLSRHERSRYWLEQSYEIYDAASLQSTAPARTAPDSETTVTLGYVRDGAHWEWICKRGAYNVRADHRPGAVAAQAPLLYASFLLLYGPPISRPLLVRVVSEPEFVAQQAMASTGYPNARGDYWCIQIAPASRQPLVATLTTADVTAIAFAKTQMHGAPTLVHWKELLGAVESSG